MPTIVGRSHWRKDPAWACAHRRNLRRSAQGMPPRTWTDTGRVGVPERLQPQLYRTTGGREAEPDTERDHPIGRSTADGAVGASPKGGGEGQCRAVNITRLSLSLRRLRVLTNDNGRITVSAGQRHQVRSHEINNDVVVRYWCEHMEVLTRGRSIT
jgi:hypothetical protein